MAIFLIQDDEEYYLNAKYIIEFYEIRYSYLFTQIAFKTYKKPITDENFENLESFGSDREVFEWTQKLLDKVPCFQDDGNTCKNIDFKFSNDCLINNVPFESKLEIVSHLKILELSDGLAVILISYLECEELEEMEFQSIAEAKKWLSENFKIIQ